MHVLPLVVCMYLTAHVQVLGLNVNALDYVGMTPLMWAAYNNQPHVVLLLKELGGDASLADIDGMRAVHWAVHKGDTAVLRVSVCVCVCECVCVCWVCMCLCTCVVCVLCMAQCFRCYVGCTTAGVCGWVHHKTLTYCTSYSARQCPKPVAPNAPTHVRLSCAMCARMYVRTYVRTYVRGHNMC